MEKLLACCLALLMLLPLAACAKAQPAATETPTETTVIAEPVTVETPVVVTAEPVPTPAPTVAPTVEPQLQPAAGDQPLIFRPQELYEANIFLSNFSEQGFCEGTNGNAFDADYVSVAQLFKFAHTWAKINRQSAIEYVDGYETMTRENFIDIAYRYFDLSTFPEPAEGADYSAELGMGRFDWDHCWYANGRFYYPAADGEAHSRFSVVTEAVRHADNRVTLYFKVYELDLDIYWAHQGSIPSEYYWLSDTEAMQRAAAGEITQMSMGEALCTPSYHEDSGRASYVLDTYKIYAPDFD